MPSTTDPEKFERKWNSHIDELELLKHSLPVDAMDDVDAVIEEAKALVEQGAEHVDAE